jgi:hypothetical protein
MFTLVLLSCSPALLLSCSPAHYATLCYAKSCRPSVSLDQIPAHPLLAMAVDVSGTVIQVRL